MANTFAVSRNHLIFGLCLPLAVLLGYLLAEPLELGTQAVVVLVLVVLFAPLLMRWHHPLLVLSWNAALNPVFFPGRPYIWMVMSFISFFFAILNRSLSNSYRMLKVPPLTWSLLTLLGVVLVTALLTGGIGIRVLNSATHGGRGYFFILAAVVGYFALSAQPVPPHRAQWFVAMFFLSGLSSIISNLVYFAGPGFHVLYDLFPPEMVIDQARAEWALGDIPVRNFGVMVAALAGYSFLLARYGVAGVLDLARPWRLMIFLVAVFCCMIGGYRSVLALTGLTFLILFWIEGLWRTRFLFILLFLGLASSLALAVWVDRLPLSVQRAVSFLPIKVDAVIKEAANSSTEWRVEMWRSLWPEVPRYLFKGKGYALSPQEVWQVQEAAQRGHMRSADAAATFGDYHNGLLSVAIPFGIYGLAAYLWFLGAGLWLLYHNLRYGDPALRHINAFLFAAFAARIVHFFLIFGAFYTDLYHFTGIAGLSVALNGGVRRPAPAVAAEESPEESMRYASTF